MRSFGRRHTIEDREEEEQQNNNIDNILQSETEQHEPSNWTGTTVAQSNAIKPFVAGNFVLAMLKWGPFKEPRTKCGDYENNY